MMQSHERIERLDPFSFVQWEGVFPLCGDSLALGEFATVRSGWSVCDLGTGSGLLLLLLARREGDIKLAGIEIDPNAAENARHNLAQNGLSGEMITGDFCKNNLSTGRFDLVISNPPYFTLKSGAVAGESRSEVSATLGELCSVAARLLKNGGRFALCHRPERLVDVFAEMRRNGIEPKRLQMMRHRQEAPPSAVLIEGVRQGKAALTVLPDLLRNEAE